MQLVMIDAYLPPPHPRPMNLNLKLLGKNGLILPFTWNLPVNFPKPFLLLWEIIGANDILITKLGLDNADYLPPMLSFQWFSQDAGINQAGLRLAEYCIANNTIILNGLNCFVTLSILPTVPLRPEASQIIVSVLFPHWLILSRLRLTLRVTIFSFCWFALPSHPKYSQARLPVWVEVKLDALASCSASGSCKAALFYFSRTPNSPQVGESGGHRSSEGVWDSV